MIRYISLILLLAVAPNISSGADQSDSCAARTVPINLLTPENRDIHPDDFNDSSRKSAARIASIDADTFPKQIVILLDASGSVVNNPPLWRANLNLASKL